ncbi:MAG: hypothetical protein P1P76_01315 [Anaerolineales bacterium]|nr:hypothetical protein [Anaerolineales bacterium]
MKSETTHPASFRDRSGFLFTADGRLHRQVNTSYKQEYDLLIDSGLFQALREKGYIIPHEEVETEQVGAVDAYKVLKPEPIEFISYPYEWSFSQLKDAALLTLEIQKIALDYGMSLKDASAFNIQFHRGRPILIDTLSFETYRQGEPWVAYRQFCQHFLAPLALMAQVDVRLQKLLTGYIDGIPIDLASRLLPYRTRLNFGILTHIHLHAASQRRFRDQEVKRSVARGEMNLTAMRGLVDSLGRTVEALEWKPEGTEWADYYTATHNYADQSLRHKVSLVESALDRIQPAEVWDLGANTGIFSRLASDREIPTISFDIDPGAVELNYRQSKETEDEWRLPLLLDLTNPTPAIGWNNTERDALLQRGPAEFVMALALIHHLAISNNVPMHTLAAFFQELGKYLLIEFVPKSDPQVMRLLAFREDIFDDYDQLTFEREFDLYFKQLQKDSIRGSDRTIYLYERKT